MSNISFPSLQGIRSWFTPQAKSSETKTATTKPKGDTNEISSAGVSAYMAKIPKGNSAIGDAVNLAIWKTNRGSISPEKAVTKGSIEEIWLNDTDAEDEIINKVIDLLPDAKEEICIQTYLFYYDEDASKRLLDALAAKQKENPNFKVHFAVNGDVNPLAKTLSEALAERGVKADYAQYQPDIPNRAANHAKIFIVDGNTAIIGGDNIDNPQEKDLMVKVRGPVVDSLLEDFDNTWKDSKRFSGSKEPPTHNKVEIATDSAPQVPMTIMSKPSVALVGNYYNNNADQGFLAAIKAAKEEICVLSPNINDTVFMDAMQDALERGVKVKVVLPKDYGGIGPIIDRADNNEIVRLWTKLPADAQKNLEVKWFSSDGKTFEDAHTKFLTVDGVWSYVGSQNMDNQSWSFSRELGLGIDDQAQTEKLKKTVFDPDWKNGIAVKPSWLDKALPTSPHNWLERLFGI